MDKNEQPGQLIPLTPRELEVAQYLCDGLSVKDIATKLNLSTKTAQAHRYNLTRKLNVHGIASLINFIRGPVIIKVESVRGERILYQVMAKLVKIEGKLDAMRSEKWPS